MDMPLKEVNNIQPEAGPSEVVEVPTDPENKENNGGQKRQAPISSGPPSQTYVPQKQVKLDVPEESVSETPQGQGPDMPIIQVEEISGDAIPPPAEPQGPSIIAGASQPEAGSGRPTQRISILREFDPCYGSPTGPRGAGDHLLAEALIEHAEEIYVNPEAVAQGLCESVSGDEEVALPSSHGSDVTLPNTVSSGSLQPDLGYQSTSTSEEGLGKELEKSPPTIALHEPVAGPSYLSLTETASRDLDELPSETRSEPFLRIVPSSSQFVSAEAQVSELVPTESESLLSEASYHSYLAAQGFSSQDISDLESVASRAQSLPLPDSGSTSTSPRSGDLDETESSASLEPQREPRPIDGSKIKSETELLRQQGERARIQVLPQPVESEEVLPSTSSTTAGSEEHPKEEEDDADDGEGDTAKDPSESMKGGGPGPGYFALGGEKKFASEYLGGIQKKQKLHEKSDTPVKEGQQNLTEYAELLSGQQEFLKRRRDNLQSLPTPRQAQLIKQLSRQAASGAARSVIMELADEIDTMKAENNQLRLELNSLQQAKMESDLAISKTEEVIIKTQAEAIKNEQALKSEIKQLKEKLKENSKLINDDHTVKDLQDQLKEAKEREAKAIAELQQRQKDELNYQQVMSDYEHSLTIKLDESQKKQEELEVTKNHLANLEIAFSDVHSKYEKSKEVLNGLQLNEQSLLQMLDDAQKTISSDEEKYQSLKAHAKAQIDKSNREIAILKKEDDQEIKRLQSLVKMQEIKISSLENSLKQKTAECEQLSALCDEVTGRIS